MENYTILTEKEVQRLTKFSREHSSNNIVIKTCLTNIGNVTYITTQNDFVHSNEPHWENVTDWDSM